MSDLERATSGGRLSPVDAAGQASLEPAAEPESALTNQNRRSWVRSSTVQSFTRNHGAVAGAIVLLILLAMAVFAPVLAPYSPTAQNSADVFSPPNLRHLLGTDSLGRDLLSRIIYGSRISLSVGVVSVLASMLLGVPFGVVAAYVGGTVDDVMMRCLDVLMAMPGLVLAIAIVAATGPSLWGVVAAIAISVLPGIVRLARAEALTVRQLEYVDAARAIGARDLRIMLMHIVPNITGTLVVQGSLYMGVAILVEAGLSFLGLGIQPPTPTWGGMISDGRQFIFTTAYVGILPGIFIMLASLAFNLVGDGLRDAIDPRSKVRAGR